jgi:heparan-sulfate lyase
VIFVSFNYTWRKTQITFNALWEIVLNLVQLIHPLIKTDKKLMMKHENRRHFIKKIGLISLAAGNGNLLSVDPSVGQLGLKPTDRIIKMASLSPLDIFSVLDLDLPELNVVKKTLKRKGFDAALSELLAFYRGQYPKTAEPATGLSVQGKDSAIKTADDLGNHIFQWGPYAPASYGKDIDWAADPAGDIEWIAAIYRFYWASDLAVAYEATGDERYARIFIDLTTDWIKKHPLEKTVNIDHPVYDWTGYPWLDLQTGIRATNLCSCFRVFVHSGSFTPHFLAVLLSSLYDHQVKTEKMPMGKIHNKAIFEQRGFINVIYTFPQFRDKIRWLGISTGITCENLLAQTTTDGVQREWCGGYHSEVYHDALEMYFRVKELGLTMPDYYHSRVRAMADYIFWISTPDLGFPMFGDTSRPEPQSGDRRHWELYDQLTDASERFNDPKYKALADLDHAHLPAPGSYAFPDAGMYAMRNSWKPDQVYMALHCSPPSINPWHDQPDNGTFELYAYGRWLMPDSGFYTYGHDAQARAWHRQTYVHPTMTLDRKDTDVTGRQLLWRSEKEQDVVWVENQSYPLFLHRRTVWFADKSGDLPFFVILDEANSDAEGNYEIHFPMAPGNVEIDNIRSRIITRFDDSNLVIQISGKHPVILVGEQGWYSPEYGQRTARTSVSALYKGKAPFVFVSVLVPYKGTEIPDCRLLTDPGSILAGMKGLKLEVEVAGRKHILMRTTQGDTM